MVIKKVIKLSEYKKNFTINNYELFYRKKGSKEIKVNIFVSKKS